MRLVDLVSRLQEWMRLGVPPEYSVKVLVRTDLGTVKVDVDHLEDQGDGVVIATE